MEELQLRQLAASLTLEEKLAQLTQLYPLDQTAGSENDTCGPLSALHIRPEWLPSIGSTQFVSRAADAIRIQQEHLAQDPHKIPLLFMGDIVHGMETVFPVPLAMACSFEPELMRKANEIAAKEASVCGIHVVFSPVADSGRDPRWGRIVENMGEDPCLGRKMTAAAVRGYQGDDPDEKYRVCACVKHFAAYGAVEGGRDYAGADVSSRTFQRYHLPNFRAAVDAGVGMVMASFNTVNGVPATVNRELLQNVLREQIGFDGVVISDYAAVQEVQTHGLAIDRTEAAARALEAGIDIEMMSDFYLNDLPSAFASGRLDMRQLDEAVLRVLQLKNRLGLFENPYKDADPIQEKELLLSAEHRAAARHIAARSMVLLKNEGVLPLAADDIVGLCGPFAESQRTFGPWAFYAKCQEGVSLRQGLEEALGKEKVVTAATAELPPQNTDPFADIPLDTALLAKQLKQVKTVIVAVGETQHDCGEATSKAILRLTPNQEALIRAVKAQDKKVVIVLFSGRPLEIAPILPYADAVLQAWFPGSESGHAIADLLTGKAEPTGRLAVSFPMTVGQIPCCYDQLITGRPFADKSFLCSQSSLLSPDPAWPELMLPKERIRKAAEQRNQNNFVSTYLDVPVQALYPFGYGLGYAQYEYSGAKQNGNKAVVVTVKNVSQRSGTETVQLYHHIHNPDFATPAIELADFQKVVLAPGEAKKIVFSLCGDTAPHCAESYYVGPCSSHLLKVEQETAL